MKKLLAYVIGGIFLLGLCMTFAPRLCSAQTAKERGKINFVYLGPMSGSAAAYGEEQFTRTGNLCFVCPGSQRGGNSGNEIFLPSMWGSGFCCRFHEKAYLGT